MERSAVGEGEILTSGSRRWVSCQRLLDAVAVTNLFGVCFSRVAFHTRRYKSTRWYDVCTGVHSPWPSELCVQRADSKSDHCHCHCHWEKIKQGTNGEEEVHSEDTQSEDDDGGHLLDLVYDAVMKGQSPYELERDGWHADEIHEAVGTWFEMRVFVRSQRAA